MRRSTIVALALLALPLMGAETDKPLPRWVLTHSMGMMPATNWYGANGLFPLTDYAKSRPPTHFTRIYGGQYRMLPLGFLHCFVKADGAYDFNDSFLYPTPQPQRAPRPDYLTNKYLWDLEWAERMGIDGFGALLSRNEASRKHAVGWFKAMEELLRRDPDTKVRVTIMFSGHELPNEAEPERYQWLKEFAAEYKASPAWLRHEGRIVLMGYRSMMTWDAKEGVQLEQARQAVAAHQAFLASLDLDDPLFIFDGTEYVPGDITHSPTPPDPQLLGPIASEVCKAFPGYMVWGGVIPDAIYQRNYPVIADAVNASGKAWGMPIVNLHSGTGQFYAGRPGVERLLDTWNFADQTGAQLAQIVTWNDSNEATSFVPSVSLNYAFSSLNARFIHRFKHGAFPRADEDAVFLFYRKYHPDADPYLYPRATVNRDADTWGETDDMLHVLVFARARGTLKVSGTSAGTVKLKLRKGFNEFKLRTAVDQKIAARIYRWGRLRHELVSPERVTDRPYREDLLPWGWSSDCRAHYDREFGPDFRPISYYSQRYEDGIPDWFRLHYFGTTELPAGGLPSDDSDGDGVDNLHEYLLGEDPTQPNPAYEPGHVWDELPTALRMANDQQYAVRINLNPYPDKHGKLVHGFLYATDGVLDGQYLHMMKWVNDVSGVPTGWTLRSGRKHRYTLTEDNGLRMELLPGWAGIYRFWSPVTGRIRVRCRVVGDPAQPVRFTIQRAAEAHFAATCKPGGERQADLVLDVALRDKIDFIVIADSAQPTAAALYPEITLLDAGKE